MPEKVCCSVLQCVAVCCSLLQCVAVCCSVLQWVAVGCSGLQWVAVCCSVLQLTFTNFCSKLTLRNSVAALHCGAHVNKTFSKVSSLLNLLCEMTVELAFEKFQHSRQAAGYLNCI